MFFRSVGFVFCMCAVSGILLVNETIATEVRCRFGSRAQAAPFDDAHLKF